MRDLSTRLPFWLPTYGPALAALGVAFAGSWLSRRWGRLAGFWAAAGTAVGWAGLLAAPWRSMAWPRTTVEFLVLPAVVLALGAVVRVRGRWVGVAAVGFAAWWLAAAPQGRAQFWRVGFGAMALAWVLGRVGSAEPRLALGVTLTAWLGLLVGGSTAVPGTALAVMVAAIAGVWLGRRDGVVPSGLSMIGLVGAEFGGGRLMRGSIGVVDVACLFALGAPWLIPRVEGWLGRRFGSGVRYAAVVVVAVGLSGAAWVAERALRG